MLAVVPQAPIATYIKAGGGAAAASASAPAQRTSLWNYVISATLAEGGQPALVELLGNLLTLQELSTIEPAALLAGAKPADSKATVVALVAAALAALPAVAAKVESLKDIAKGDMMAATAAAAAHASAQLGSLQSRVTHGFLNLFDAAARAYAVPKVGGVPPLHSHSQCPARVA